MAKKLRDLTPLRDGIIKLLEENPGLETKDIAKHFPSYPYDTVKQCITKMSRDWGMIKSLPREERYTKCNWIVVPKPKYFADQLLAAPWNSDGLSFLRDQTC